MRTSIQNIEITSRLGVAPARKNMCVFFLFYKIFFRYDFKVVKDFFTQTKSPIKSVLPYQKSPLPLTLSLPGLIFFLFSKYRGFSQLIFNADFRKWFVIYHAFFEYCAKNTNGVIFHQKVMQGLATNDVLFRHFLFICLPRKYQ